MAADAVIRGLPVDADPEPENEPPVDDDDGGVDPSIGEVFEDPITGETFEDYSPERDGDNLACSTVGTGTGSKIQSRGAPSAVRRRSECSAFKEPFLGASNGRYW
jgi:hypothetical protein